MSDRRQIFNPWATEETESPPQTRAIFNPWEDPPGQKQEIFNPWKSRDVKTILEQNREKPMVQRILNPEQYPKLELGDGTHATHRMAYGEADGKYWVYPTVVPSDEKTLVQLNDQTAWDRAMQSGDAIAFDNEDDASWFSQHYKDVWKNPKPSGVSGSWAETPEEIEKIKRGAMASPFMQNTLGGDEWTEEQYADIAKQFRYGYHSIDPEGASLTDRFKINAKDAFFGTENVGTGLGAIIEHYKSDGGLRDDMGQLQVTINEYSKLLDKMNRKGLTKMRYDYQIVTPDKLTRWIDVAKKEYNQLEAEAKQRRFEFIKKKAYDAGQYAALPEFAGAEEGAVALLGQLAGAAPTPENIGGPKGFLKNIGWTVFTNVITEPVVQHAAMESGVLADPDLEGAFLRTGLGVMTNTGVRLTGNGLKWMGNKLGIAPEKVSDFDGLVAALMKERGIDREAAIDIVRVQLKQIETPAELVEKRISRDLDTLADTGKEKNYVGPMAQKIWKKKQSKELITNDERKYLAAYFKRNPDAEESLKSGNYKDVEKYPSFLKGETPAINPTAVAVVEGIGTKIRQGLTDLYAPLEAIEKLATGTRQALDAKYSGWKAALMTRNLDHVVGQIFENGPLRYSASRGMFEMVGETKGLRQIFEDVGRTVESMQAWENFAKAGTAQERLAARGVKWEDATDGQVQKLFGFSKNEAETWLKGGDGTPGAPLGNVKVMETTSAEYAQFMEKQRDLLLETGLISVEQKNLLDKYLKYVPLNRDMRDVYGARMSGQRTGAQGMSGQGNVVKRFRGSERDINPIMENILNQTAYFTDAAMKNVAMAKNLSTLRAYGLAEKVPDVKLRPAIVTQEEAARKLKKVGADISDASMEDLDGVLELFAFDVPNARDVVSVSVKGKKRYFQVEDPGMLSALNDLGPDKTDQWLKHTLGLAKTVKTRAVTATPDFAVRNLLRDTLSTFVVTPVGLNPFEHINAVVRGAVTAMRGGVEMESLAASGAGGNMFREVDPKAVAKQLQDRTMATQILNSPKDLFKAWEKVLTAVENANRMAVREKVLQRGGSVAEANFQAMDLLNFSMHGAAGPVRFMAKTVPFVNARIQGLYKIARAAEANPSSVLAKGALLTGASMALWAHNYSDKDETGAYWYRELPLQDKLLWYHFRIPGTNSIMRLPKPFEIGALFSTIPELMLDSAVGDEKWSRAAEGVGMIAADVFNMSPTGNPLIGGPIEQWANKTTFFNNPIVPSGTEDLSPRYQYGSLTSLTSRELGDVINVSPARLDAGTQALFGSMSTYLLGASDLLTSMVTDERYPAPLRVDQYPVVGGFYRDSRTQAKRWSNEFYNLRREVNLLYNDARELRQRGELLKAMDGLTDEAAKVSLRTVISKMSDKLSVNSALREQNRNSNDPWEKRKQMEKQLLIERNRILSRMDVLLNRIDDGKVDARAFHEITKNVLKLSDKEKDIIRTYAGNPTHADRFLMRWDAINRE